VGSRETNEGGKTGGKNWEQRGKQRRFTRTIKKNAKPGAENSGKKSSSDYMNPGRAAPSELNEKRPREERENQTGGYLSPGKKDVPPISMGSGVRREEKEFGR